jgi:DNA-directed RNA polymerase subunit N (RpoN/RPB10)
MQFEWLEDPQDNHLLCLLRERCLFSCGTLSPEDNGIRIWNPFPEGEPQEVCGDLEVARYCCEIMTRLS